MLWHLARSIRWLTRRWWGVVLIECCLVIVVLLLIVRLPRNLFNLVDGIFTVLAIVGGAVLVAKLIQMIRSRL